MANSFDVEKFKNAKWNRRTKKIKITDPDLVTFFKDPKKAFWTVQSLSAEEIARCHEAKNANRNVAAMVEKAAQYMEKDSKKTVDQVSKILSIPSKDLPNDHVFRLEMLVFGSADPEIDKRTAVMLGNEKSQVFLDLTNEIYALIGKGSSLGK